jgi:hypothetical protein
MIGPFFAGILLSILSIKYLFLVDAASFLLGLALLLFITQPIHFSQPEDHNHWSELKQGLSYLFSQKPIFWMIIITFINNLFIMGPAIVGLPVLVKTALNGTASDFAFVEGCMAAGALGAVFTKTGSPTIAGPMMNRLLMNVIIIIQKIGFCEKR